MDDNSMKLSDLISTSKNILIASHGGPDPDAISCTIFAYNMLVHNFPEKKIYANIVAAEIETYNHFTDVSAISSLNLEEILEQTNPDLFLVLDLATLNLLTRSDGVYETVKQQKEKGMKIAIIDHHQGTEEMADIVINRHHNACVETVHDVLLVDLQLKPYPKYQNDVLLGIISDTGSFAHLESEFDHTFDLAKALIKEGGNIDTIQNFLKLTSKTTVKIHSEYLKNLVTNGEYTYSFLSDSFLETNEFRDAQITTANKQFVYVYLKSIESAKWGFTTRRNADGRYSISFRSVQGEIDTTVFSTKLNGNGHKSSSGGLVEAVNVEDAVKQVLAVIEENKEEAYANK